jgi:hypothetical protein
MIIESEPIILPKQDVMFKIIFANPEHPRVLIHFLNIPGPPKNADLNCCQSLKPKKFKSAIFWGWV